MIGMSRSQKSNTHQQRQGAEQVPNPEKLSGFIQNGTVSVSLIALDVNARSHPKPRAAPDTSDDCGYPFRATLSVIDRLAESSE